MGVRACAPVVLLGYHRPWMTAKVFAAIREAKPPVVILVMDGPRPGDDQDAHQVALTRDVVAKVDWDATVHRIYAETNMGLKARVSTGLDEAFSLVDEAIILEDDCLPDASFFPFATELLERYRDNTGVGMITGSSRLRGRRVSEYSYDFSGDVRIWGWATWARTWQTFSGSGDLGKRWSGEEARVMSEKFPKGSRRQAMRKMLATADRLNSWALPFVVHCVGQGYANPVPMVNLVQNIGLGPSSTHTKFESYVANVVAKDIPFPLSHPPSTQINTHLDQSESRSDARELFRYPLRHPLDTAARFYRYAKLVLAKG